MRLFPGTKVKEVRVNTELNDELPFLKRKQRKREQADLGTPETSKAATRSAGLYGREMEEKIWVSDAIELQESGAEIRRLFRYTVGPLTPRAVDLSAIKTASHNAPEWLAARKLMYIIRGRSRWVENADSIGMVD